MKRISLSIVVAGLLLGVSPIDAAVSKIRALKCSISKFHSKFKCTAEEKAAGKKWLVGTGVAVAAAALAAVIGGITVSEIKKAQDDALVISASSGVSATNIGDILSKWNVKLGQDDSPPALFIKAVTNGAGWMVNSLYDLVPKNVLEAGLHIATDRVKSAPAIYTPIQKTIRQALSSFSLSQLQNNLTFIRSALSELIGEVKSTICSVSQNAIAEAREQLMRKSNKSIIDEEMKSILEKGCSN